MSFAPLTPLPVKSPNRGAASPATIYRTKEGRYAVHVRLVVRPFIVPDFPRWFRAAAMVGVSIGKDAHAGTLRIEPDGLFLVRECPGKQPAERKPLLLMLPFFDERMPEIPTATVLDIFPRGIDVALPFRTERAGGAPRAAPTLSAAALRAPATGASAQKSGPFSISGPSLEDIHDKGRRAMRGHPSS